jgi:hypothetical protein
MHKGLSSTTETNARHPQHPLPGANSQESLNFCSPLGGLPRLTMEVQLMRFPWELIFNVMTSLLPPNPKSVIPAADEATQFLLRFSLVSRATHEISVRKLKQHCIFLDTESRLRLFLLCLQRSRESTLGLPSVFDNISTMYLAPFGSIMTNLRIAPMIREVLGYTSPTLKRLMMHMPHECLPPWNRDSNEVGMVLHTSLEQLTNLEEFVCTGDAVRLQLPGEENDSSVMKPVLYKWPKLVRLCLNTPVCNARFWECISAMSNLTHVVLVRATEFPRGESELGIVSPERRSRPITIVVADIMPKEKFKAFARTTTRLRSGDESMRIINHKIPIPIPKAKYFFDSGSEWVMGTARCGDLWDMMEME